MDSSTQDDFYIAATHGFDKYPWNQSTAHISAPLPDSSQRIEADGPLSEVENIQGWRRVQVLPMGILASPQQAEAMLERVSPPARCLDNSRTTLDGVDLPTGHKPPVHDCCGWHAMYEEKTLAPWATGWVRILVSAQGETLLCRLGFIAERIRLDEVRVPKGFDETLAKKLAERYGVPVYEQEEPCTSESPSSESSPDQIRRLRDISRQLSTQPQSIQNALRYLQSAPVPTPPPSPQPFQPGFPADRRGAILEARGRGDITP